MSGFHEYRSPQVETDTEELYYDDHVDGLHPERSASPRHRSSRHDVNRDVTWITTSQVPSHMPSIIPGPPPPAEAGPSRPLPIPTAPGGFAPSEELDAEYMTVDPDEDFDGAQSGRDSQSQWRKGGPRNFVGGFVSGLKKLPRVVLRRPGRRGTGDTGGTGETLPVYHSPILTAIPNAQDVLYVEASEMPVEHPAPAPEEQYSHHTDARSYHSHLTDGRDHHTDGRSHHTDARSHHTDARSHHTDARSHHSDARSYHADGRSHHTNHSIAHENTYDTHATAHSTHEYAPYEGETAETNMGHDRVPAAELIPIPVEILPSSDYDKMESPLRSPSETSLNSRFVRAGRFFQDLYDLPWVATRITADYIPSEQSRAKYARKKPTTWYPDHLHSPIDLLAGDGYSPPPRVQPPRNYNPDYNRNRVPNSTATLAYNQGRPEGRNRSPPYERSRSPPYSRYAYGAQYPVYPQGYAPEYTAQPLYVYPSAVPQVQQQGGMHSSSVGQPQQEQAPEMQQARPVYMVAPSPPRPFMPPPPDPTVHAPPAAYYSYTVPRGPPVPPA
jgi:hypothetical protein